MNELLRKLQEADKIIFFGYGRFGQFLFDFLVSRNIPDGRIVFSDNTPFKNKSILSVEEACLRYPVGIFVLSVRYFRNEMLEQLERLGIEKKNIILELPHEVYELFDEKMIQKRTRKQRVDEFTFEVNICKHCNLNCSYCEHFSPLAEPSYMELENFNKDINRLSQLFSGISRRILILGGEPLLHSDVGLFLYYTRRAFPSTEIMLVTNGILLSRMKPDFWKICKDYKIHISITKYPIHLDYEMIKEVGKGHGVECHFFDSTGFSPDGRNFSHLPFDLSGQQDVDNNFQHCGDANHCVTLENGRLYTCTVAANSYIFNQYFNTNVKITDSDSINIYEAKTADEILEFLANPIPFCRFCDIEHRVRNKKWSISKRDIKEWTL